ncbi:MAG: helix-turn-helix domain-containing protein [Verrucomicrobia bacterium]|nr:helix-turn-helix domain-containing protein [Verrucomicrobiota bacterium]MDE3098771.1 helix-turn-helix transcriptional regulator [Verrucomicrobiota bacterium]
MKPIIQAQVGRRIRDIRKRHRLTQEELAAWLHALHPPITRNMVANWETGRCDVPAFCIQLIAHSLQVKVSDILPDLTFKEVIARHVMPKASKQVVAQPVATETATIH